MDENYIGPIMAANANNMARVWRSIKEVDDDKNGFLSTDELEGCFREHFAPELEGKSLVYFFRRWSTDHDKELVNYRLIKAAIMARVDLVTPSKAPQSRFMQRSGTTSNLNSDVKSRLGMITSGRSNFGNNGPIKASADIFKMEKFNLEPPTNESGGTAEKINLLPKLNRFNVRALDQRSIGDGVFTPGRQSRMNGSVSQMSLHKSDVKTNSQVRFDPVMRRPSRGLQSNRSDNSIGMGAEQNPQRAHQSPLKMQPLPNNISARLDELNQSRQQFQRSVSGLSKAKSVASLRLNKMDTMRAQAFNSDLTLKLSYEWKNIYRSILQGDILQKGQTSVSKFTQILHRHNVALTKEEIRRLAKLSRGQPGQNLNHSGEFSLEDSETTIDYVQLSKNLGLHKNSLKLMSQN